MTPKKTLPVGEPMTAEAAYSEITYDGLKGPIRVLPAWGQKTVPETYFRKLGFKNLAPQKHNELAEDC